MVLSMDGARHFPFERSDTSLRDLEVIFAQKLYILYRINKVEGLLPTCGGDKLLSNCGMSLYSALQFTLLLSGGDFLSGVLYSMETKLG